MNISDRISRGILTGGAVGALSAVFGFSDNMFMAVGIGAVAGLAAGLTHGILDRKRKDKARD
ncbi:MAG: hypothetical protein LBQ51_03905 [Desulfovibrio sp.]|jgi:ABC-type uncharacterized transport system permease subunit|nr:hypothetical protein [Desulfovibrio sp.]